MEALGICPCKTVRFFFFFSGGEEGRRGIQFIHDRRGLYILHSLPVSSDYFAYSQRTDFSGISGSHGH